MEYQELDNRDLDEDYNNINTMDEALESDGLEEIFPPLAKELMEDVSKAIDNVDYRGSFIYDIFPDRVRLNAINNAIFANVSVRFINNGACNECEKKHITDIIWMLMYNELSSRRYKDRNTRW